MAGKCEERVMFQFLFRIRHTICRSFNGFHVISSLYFAQIITHHVTIGIGIQYPRTPRAIISEYLVANPRQLDLTKPGIFQSASQYGVSDRILDCCTFDITKSPFRIGSFLDAIVSDPPCKLFLLPFPPLICLFRDYGANT